MNAQVSVGLTAESPTTVTPQRLVGLLADPSRTRVFAALVLGADSAAEVARRTGLAPRAVASALHRLTVGGLVTRAGGRLAARAEAFQEAARTRQVAAAGAEPPDPDPQRAAVLRAFLVEGRLVSIPAAAAKRRVVLEHIVMSFEPGRRYPEREVDVILRAWHADHAALRRYLVDENLLARDGGVYWRSGGPTWAYLGAVGRP